MSSGESLPARTAVDKAMPESSGRAIGLAGMLIVLAGLAAYSNSFGGPFTFDDVGSILRNPTIQHGWAEALQPPAGAQTVSARPLVNLSLALNYQLGGFNVWGYHAFNLIIQLLAGLTLFGLVRRTLVGPVLRARYGLIALPLAFVIALLWTLHPLQTEAVTYVIQRAESLMGLFYLLTLYCFVRGTESSRPWVWYALSAPACALGMITKETMVTAPLLVWLYDRTFVAGTFAGAWRQRGKVYAALAATWLPLAWIVISVSWPGNAAQTNPGLDGLSPLMKSFVYALKQYEAVGQYLWLSFWPHPLVFNYGADVVTNPVDVAPQIVVLTLLVGGSIFALRRKPALGFLGAWFFVILAPTSSVVPLAGQTMAEHHIYLSLAAVMVLLALGLHTVLGRPGLVAGLILALGLGFLTFERNHDYRTEISLWSDTLQKRPDDASSHDNLGGKLQMALRLTEAVARYQSAIGISPNTAKYYYNLGTAYEQEGRLEPAAGAYVKATQVDPDLAEAHDNLGNVYLELKRPADAIVPYATVIRLKPDFGNGYLGLANALYMTGQSSAAAPQYETALRLMPDSAGTHSNYGLMLIQMGRFADAAHQFAEVLRVDPQYPRAQDNLKNALHLAQQRPPPTAGP